MEGDWMKRTKKYGKAPWVSAFPEQATPNNAVLAGRRKARYERKARAFKRAHPTCQVCGAPTQDVHHKAGRRGDRLLDDTKFLATCRPCHDWITTHHKEAVRLGYSLSRA